MSSDDALLEQPVDQTARLDQRHTCVHEFDAAFREELQFVRNRRALRGMDTNAPLGGLALSGGGLRAAAFSLGAVRAFHERGVFKRFDYLSSVSGGSLAGACLNWFARSGCQLWPDAARGNEILPPKGLSYVRRHANYLAPAYHRSTGEAGSPATLVERESGLGMAVFRSTVLSLFVHGSLLVGVFFLLNRLDAVVALFKPVLRLVSRRPIWSSFVDVLNFGLLAAALLLSWAIFISIVPPGPSTFWSAWKRSSPQVVPEPRARALKGAFWLLASMFCCILAVASAFSREVGAWTITLAIAFAGCAGAAFWRGRALWRAASREQYDPHVEGRRPDFGWLAILLGLLPALVLTVTILLYVFRSGHHRPYEPVRLNVLFGALLLFFSLGSVALLLPRAIRRVRAFCSALFSEAPPSEVSSGRRTEWFRQERFGSLVSWSGLLVLLGTVSLVSAHLTRLIQHPALRLSVLGGLTALGLVLVVRRAPPPIGRVPSSSDNRRAKLIGGTALIYGTLVLAHVVVLAALDSSIPHVVWVVPLLGFLIGSAVNVNSVSPGSANRERQAEAFLPDDAAVGVDAWQPALSAMDFRLSRAADSERAPYPLFNAALRIDRSCDARRQARGVDGFLLSPLFCGSDATGYARTRCWAGDAVQLSDAMGISAAAVAPTSTGPSARTLASRLFAHAVSLLNLRLSVWIENPRLTSCTPHEGRPRPNFLWPMLSQAFGRRLSESQGYVELSDGAHFDELGLHELIRRKLKFIVALDASHDPKRPFSGLVRSLERARVDLGVEIDASLDELGAADWNGERQNRTCVVVRIRHRGDNEAGILICLKAAVAVSSSDVALSRTSAGPQVPFQSAPDACFDELQFEAQYQLGYAVARQACDQVGELGGQAPGSEDPRSSQARAISAGMPVTAKGQVS